MVHAYLITVIILFKAGKHVMKHKWLCNYQFPKRNAYSSIQLLVLKDRF